MNNIDVIKAEGHVSLETSEDKRTIALFIRATKKAEFPIDLLWDMIRDTMATIDVSPMSNPGLFRRKGEALAALTHTNKMFAEYKDEKASS